MSEIQHVGPVRDMPVSKIVEAAQMVKEGRYYSLSVARFPGMPLFPGHPPFQVLNYRTPPGIKAGTSPGRASATASKMSPKFQLMSPRSYEPQSPPAGRPTGHDTRRVVVRAKDR